MEVYVSVTLIGKCSSVALGVSVLEAFEAAIQCLLTVRISSIRFRYWYGGITSEALSDVFGLVIASSSQIIRTNWITFSDC